MVPYLTIIDVNRKQIWVNEIFRFITLDILKNLRSTDDEDRRNLEEILKSIKQFRIGRPLGF